MTKEQAKEQTISTLLSEGVDAEDLRQKNFEAAEAAYNQWYVEHHSKLLEIEEQILTANEAGKRTIGVIVPPEETQYYERFFEERHFEIEFERLFDGDKMVHAILKLDWSGKPTSKLRFDSKEEALMWLLSHCKLVN